MQTLLICIFHFKSLMIATPSYWIIIVLFSRTVLSNVKEALILLIFFVSCFILHLQAGIAYPIPSPATLSEVSIYPPKEFRLLGFTIANKVICKESYFRLNISSDSIDVQREQHLRGQEPCPVGDT